MKLHDDGLQDCSRAFLEAAEASLNAMINSGYGHLGSRLELVRRALANNPTEYDIHHRPRR